MSEFIEIPTEKLHAFKTAIKAYKQGCEDTFILIKEQHERTMKLYDEKIRLCEQEIDNRK